MPASRSRGARAGACACGCRAAPAPRQRRGLARAPQGPPRPACPRCCRSLLSRVEGTGPRRLVREPGSDARCSVLTVIGGLTGRRLLERPSRLHGRPAGPWTVTAEKWSAAPSPPTARIPHTRCEPTWPCPIAASCCASHAGLIPAPGFTGTTCCPGTGTCSSSRAWCGPFVPILCVSA